MSHWCNPLIRDKIIKNCEETGVLVTEQFSFYRSQRCNSCGWVQKSNRKGKIFKCQCCGHKDDSDVNAAKNHLSVLPDLPPFLLKQKLNIKGFFWNSKGIYDTAGVELTVPLSLKISHDTI